MTTETAFGSVRRWELWLLSFLFSAVVYFAIQDRNRIATTVDTTRARQIVNEERITRLEEHYEQMQVGQEDLKRGQIEINRKLDNVLNILANRKKGD